jgi:hypothetical protein
MDLSHLPGKMGDHGPISGAFEHDEPFFNKMYSDPQSTGRAKIDINNWKDAEAKWSRRFK